MSEKTTPALRLKQLIEKKRISKKKFAELCDCNPATLSRILNEKCSISSNLLERFSDILGVSKEYIMCQTDNPTPEINLLDLMDTNKRLQIITSVLDLFNNLGFTFTEKVRIGVETYVRSNVGNFYLDSNGETQLTENEICELILSSTKPVFHIYAVSKSMPDSNNAINVIYDKSNHAEYKHISAEEFYSYLENYINLTRTYLTPYRLRHSFTYPPSLIDNAIRKRDDLRGDFEI